MSLVGAWLGTLACSASFARLEQTAAQRGAAAATGIMDSWRPELPTNLRKVSQCPEKPPTRAFSLLKAPTRAFTINQLEKLEAAKAA